MVWYQEFLGKGFFVLHLPSYLFRGKNRMEISIYLYFGEKIEIDRVLKMSLYEIRKFWNTIYLSISYAQSMRCNTVLPLSLWSCNEEVEVTMSLKFQSGNIWRLRFRVCILLFYIYIFFPVDKRLLFFRNTFGESESSRHTVQNFKELTLHMLVFEGVIFPTVSTSR